MMKKAKTYSLTRRILFALLALLIITLVVLRLYLSTWLLEYVNNVLAHLNGYKGSVESINIDLYRGAYRINKLVVNKINGHIPTPFIDINVVDFSVEWSALLHGRIVSYATLEHPVLNFAVNRSSVQDGTEVDWNKPIRDLMPIDINHVDIKDGTVTYQDFSSTPHVNVYIHHMQGELRNLRNVEDPHVPLPSTIDIQGGSIGNGHVHISGRMNILPRSPNMDLKLALENVNLPALNSYTEAYAAFDFSSGNFNLYSELITHNDRVSGYVKPIATNISVDVFKSPNPLEVAWSAAVAVVLKLFSNFPRDQFATRVDMEGSLGNINTNTWSTIGGILYNAFIKAMSRGFDQTGRQDLIPDKN